MDRIEIDVRKSDEFIGETMKEIVISEDEGIKAMIGRLKSDPNRKPFFKSFIFSNKSKSEAEKWVEEKGKSAEWVLGHNLDVENRKAEISKSVNKALSFELKKFNDEERTFDAIASTEDIDRDGDILSVTGWVLKNFKKNPVMLWMHDAYSLPVGRAENVRIEDGKLMFTPKFMTEDLNPLADRIYKMYKAGFLSSFSVRFDPIEWEDLKLEDVPKGTKRIGRRYKKQELLEISPVTIPANAAAIAQRAVNDPDGLVATIKSFSAPKEDPAPVIDAPVKSEAQQEAKTDTKQLEEKIKQLEAEVEELKSQINIDKSSDGEIERLKKELESIELKSDEDIIKRAKSLLSK